MHIVDLSCRPLNNVLYASGIKLLIRITCPPLGSGTWLRKVVNDKYFGLVEPWSNFLLLTCYTKAAGTDKTMLQSPMIFHQQPTRLHHATPHFTDTARPEYSPHNAAHLLPSHPPPPPPPPPPSRRHRHYIHGNPHRTVRVSPSEIETGVWTSTDIPADATFGPYDGEFTLGNGMKDHRGTPYMLEVKYINGRLISGPDSHTTRWMRFVSPVRKEFEHNMEAECSSPDEQSCPVVFRTTRPILKGEELLVWYSTKLANKDGVPVSVNRFKGKDGFTCSRCCSNFCYPNTLKAHMRFQCYDKDSAIVSRHLLNHHQESSVDESSLCGSAFHRVSSAATSSSEGILASSVCSIVAESPTSNSRLGHMDDHVRHQSDVISSSNSSPSPTRHLKALFATKLGSGTGSAFRPTCKGVGSNDVDADTNAIKVKEGFHVVVRKGSSTIGSTTGACISPTDSRLKIESETFDREKRRDNPGVAFSMDKVLSMPRVNTARTPGVALAYLQVQKALENGRPTYDPVISHTGELPISMRTVHRGPLGLDPYMSYPYRFLTPSGFPMARLPSVLPIHRHSEVFNRIAYTLPYPGLPKYPEPAAAPPALLTPPPEIDPIKYTPLERNVAASQAPQRNFAAGEPQFAYTQSPNGKSRRGHLCIYCGKLYSRKYGLKIHLRTHTGYKPLKCKVCLRPFGDPSNLNKHVRLHAEGDTPYRCEYCGKVLVRRRDLERHIRSRHPTECERKTDETAVARENEDDNAEDITISVDMDDEQIDCVDVVNMTDDDRQS